MLLHEKCLTPGDMPYAGNVQLTGDAEEAVFCQRTQQSGRALQQVLHKDSSRDSQP